MIMASPERDSVVRWMTAFDTSASDVDAFLADIRATAAGQQGGNVSRESSVPG